MPTHLWRKSRIRCEIDLNGVGKNFTDRLTGSLPKAWRGAALNFEGAFFEANVLADISYIQSLTISIRASIRLGPDLVTPKTLAFAEMYQALTLEDWLAGIRHAKGQHFRFSFTAEEMNFGINQTEDKVWVLLSGFNSDNEKIVEGATQLTIVEAGATQGVAFPPPPALPPTPAPPLSDLEAIFIKKAGDHFNGVLIADTGGAIKGCPLPGYGELAWEGKVAVNRVSAPTEAIGGSTVTTGTLAGADYDYVVAYSDGTKETAISPVFTVTVGAATGVILNDVPVSPNCLVSERRIYRQTGGGGFFYIGSINDNETTDFTDDGLATDLGHTPIDGGNFIGLLSVDGDVNFLDASGVVTARMRDGQYQLIDPDADADHKWKAIVIFGGGLALGPGEPD